MMKRAGLWAVAWGLLCLAAPGAVTINAADFAVKQTAQDGNLYAPGKVGAYISVATAGTYTFGLYAQGTPVAGVYPKVGLSLNGFVKQQQTIGQFPALYTFSGVLSAGVHQVGWFLHNDAYTDTEDRNVYIAYMTIAPPAGGAEAAVSTRAAWVTAAQSRENAAVAESASLIDTHRKGTLRVQARNVQGQPIAGATVTVQQLSHAFRFGASIAGLNSFSGSTLNASYANKFKAVFNYATVPVYWSLIEPQPGVYDFSRPDAQAAWAYANGMRVKGHAVLYALDAALPGWMNGQIPTVQQQLDHVAVLMQRYAGGIKTWEIVNEPANAPGMAIDTAQAWARQLDPGAELVINDYGEFYNGYPELYALLQEAIGGGVPFDTIGLQAHAPLDMAFPLDRVRDILAHYATLGKAIHITEFCPSSGGYAVTGNAWRTVWDEATQADYAEKFYRVCFASPSVEAVSWWDVSDAASWCPQGGLLRADMSSKPSYDRLNTLINTEWRTSPSGTTDGAGNYAPRVFHGAYRVTVSAGGKTQTSDVTVAKGADTVVTASLDVTQSPPPAVTVSRLITKNTKPTLGGTISNATGLTVRVNGVNYAGVISGGTWSAVVTNTLAAGTYDVLATATGLGGTATDTTAADLTVDLTKPVITLIGSSSINVKRYATYTDAGATASDNVDGNITARIVKTGTVNTSLLGTYYIRYNVSDTAGNAATQVTRTVKVVR